MQVVSRVGRLLQNDAVRRGQVSADGIESLGRLAVTQADAGKHAEALCLYKDLSFLAFLRTDLVTEVVIRAQKPFAVPAMLVDQLFHPQHGVQTACGFASIG